MPRAPVLPVLLLALPAATLAATGTNDPAAERSAIARYQDADQRLQDVGWRLARANAAFCPRTVASIGLQLQDMASYGVPDLARAALGLDRDFAVQTAARSSPAAQDGGFRRNREVTGLGDLDPNRWPTQGRLDWQRLARVHDHVDARLREAGSIAIAFADGGTAQVEAVEVCATRFELAGEGGAAVADGRRVVIGLDFPAFAYPEEVFAGLVAHELAHNVLGHDAWLDRNGRSRRHVRLTEREADRLMPWLLANAGYPPEAAVTFMETWGRRHDGGWLRIRKRDGWDERAALIAAELPMVERARAGDGRADWSRHFRREIDPLQAPGQRRSD